MSNIDRRIVDMQFNNKQFEQGVSETVSSLDRLKKGLNLNGATSGLDSVKDAASKMGFADVIASVETLTNKFGVLGIAGMTAISNITNRVVDMGVALGKSLSIDQITTGFTKYEKKTSNVQTLINSTGKSMEEINGYLNQLMWFSDETSYGFTDMTAALSQMTSAGGDVEKLVPLITGVANAVAFSGKGAAEFSRAMYNLNQSYSSGSLNLMDMKSLDLAGVSSQQLKEELIAAGEALGTIEKGSVTVASFNDSLNKKWANREVMEKAFGSFAELSNAAFEAVEAGEFDTASEAISALSSEYSDLSVKAFKAAQTAKSFTEAIDATKDAVSSGWMKTFEIVFGDYSEATELWTGVTNELWEVFASGAGARNDMLQGWKDLGGREDMIRGIAGAWTAVKEVLGAVGEGFRHVFPPMTSEKLASITKGFADFMEKLKPSEKLLETIKETFKAFFSVLSLGLGVVKEVFGILIDKIKDLVGPHTEAALDFLTNISKSITNFSDEVKGFDSVLEGISKRLTTDILNPFLSKFGTSVEKIGEAFKSSKIITHLQELFQNMKPLETLSNIFNDVGNALKNAYNYIKPLLDKLGEALATGFNFIKQRLADFFGDGNIKSTNMDILGVGVLFGVFNGLKTLIEKIKDVFGGNDIKSLLTEGIASIVGSLDALKDTLVAYQNAIKAEALKSIAIALGLLTGSILVLSLIDTANLAKAVVAVGALMAELVLASKTLGSKGGLGLIGTSVGLTAFATAILVLSAAVSKLADIPVENLSQGLIGVGILISMVVATTKTLKAIQPSIISTSIGLTIFSTAINLLANSVKKLGMEDFDNIKQGLFAVGVILAEVAAFTKMANLNETSIGTAIGMVVIAMALRKLAESVEFFGKMDVNELQQGVLALGVIMGILSAFTHITGNDKQLLQMSVAVGSIAGSMTVLSNVIEKLGKMSLEELAKGVGALGASIAIIGIALEAIDSKGVISKAAALSIIVGSLGALQSALNDFGSMELSTIAKGLLAMGGSLGILVIALNGMKGTLGSSLALTAAAFALGLLVPPLIALGSIPFMTLIQGLVGIAGVFAVLGLGGLLLTPVIPILNSLALSLLAFAGSMALLGASLFTTAIGLDMFAVSMAANSASFMIFMTTMLSLIPIAIQKIGEGVVLFIKVIGEAIPEILDVFGKIITGILEFLKEKIPEVVNTFLTIVDEILKGISEKLPSIIQSGMDIIMAFLTGINDNIYEIVSTAAQIIVNFVNGISDNMGDIVEAGFDLVISFINGVADSIRNNKKAIWDAVFNLIGAILEAIAEFFVQLWNKGGEVVGNVLGGIGEAIPEAISGVIGFAGDIVGGFLGGIGDFASGLWDAGVNIVSSTVDGVAKKAGELWEGTKQFGSDIANAFGDGVNALGNFLFGTGEDAAETAKDGIDKGSKSKGGAKPIGERMTNEFKTGMESRKTTTETAAKNIATGAADKMKSGITDKKSSLYASGSEVGSHMISGLEAGVNSRAWTLANAASNAASGAIRSARATLEIASPSKVGIEMGEYFVEGQVIGVENLAGRLASTSGQVAQGSIDAMEKALNKAGTIKEIGLIDQDPVIRPVLDLDKIKEGAKRIGDFFSVQPLQPAFSAASASSLGYALNRQVDIQDTKPEQVKVEHNTYHVAESATFHVREEADIKKVSEELAREIERKRRG